MGRRGVFALVILGGGLVGVVHCADEPTQIVVDIRAAEDECATVRSTVVREGPLKQIDSAPISGEKRNCDVHSETIGRVVLIPRGAENASFGFQAVTGLNQQEASQCSPGNPDCIVQSRLLTFRPREIVYIDIFMSSACRGKVCAEGQTCNQRGICVANDLPPGCEAPPCGAPTPGSDAATPAIDAGPDAPSTGEDGIKCRNQRCFDPTSCWICGSGGGCTPNQPSYCQSGDDAFLQCDDPFDCPGLACCVEMDQGGSIFPLNHGGSSSSSSNGSGGIGGNTIRARCDSSCQSDEAEMCVPNGAPCRNGSKTCKEHPRLKGYFACQ